MPTPYPTPRYAQGGVVPASVGNAGARAEDDDRVPALLGEGGCYSRDPFTGMPGPGADPWATALASAEAAGQPGYLLVLNDVEDTVGR